MPKRGPVTNFAAYYIYIYIFYIDTDPKANKNLIFMMTCVWGFCWGDRGNNQQKFNLERQPNLFEHCYPFGQIHDFLFLERQTTFIAIFKHSLSIEVCLNTAARLKTLCFTSLKWIIQCNGLLAQDLCLATNAQRAKPMQQPQQLDTQTATGKQKQTTQTPTRSPEYQPLTQTSSSSQAPTRQPLPSQIKEGPGKMQEGKKRVYLKYCLD